MSHRNVLIRWLHKAVAAERIHIAMLERLNQKFNDFDEVYLRFEQLRAQVEGQLSGLSVSLGELSGSDAVIDGVTYTAHFSVVGTDRINTHGEGTLTRLDALEYLYAFGYSEHAHYVSLALAARLSGYGTMADLFDEYAIEEQRAAVWIEQQLPQFVEEFLSDES